MDQTVIGNAAGEFLDLCAVDVSFDSLAARLDNDIDGREKVEMHWWIPPEVREGSATSPRD